MSETEYQNQLMSTLPDGHGVITVEKTRCHDNADFMKVVRRLNYHSVCKIFAFKSLQKRYDPN